MPTVSQLHNTGMDTFSDPHHGFHEDTYRSAPLLSNPSTDSSSSSDSDASMGQLITPRGSVSSTATDPVHVRLPSDSSSMTYRHGDLGLALPVASRKKSNRTLRPKTSFSSWKSSFSSSSVSLRLRPSQDSQDGAEDPISPRGTRRSGQFDDAHSSPSSRSMASLKTHLHSDATSLPMTPGVSGSSQESNAEGISRGTTRKFISSLRRLGGNLRPASIQRRMSLRNPLSPSTHQDIPLGTEDGSLHVSYIAAAAPTAGNGVIVPLPSFVAYTPPDGGSDRSRAGDGKEERTEGQGEIGRGLFSPGPPETPVVPGIQGTLSRASGLPSRPTTSLPAVPKRGVHPNPVQMPTSSPSLSQSSHPSRSRLPSLTLICDNLPSSPKTGIASTIIPSEASCSGLSSAKSDSTRSIRSLNRLSTLSIGSSSGSRSPASIRTGSGFRTGHTTPTNLTCTPIYPSTGISGLPSRHSTQSLSISSTSISDLRRASSLRSADRISRGSPTPTGSPSATISPAFTVTRRNSPIPPSLILTPKALVPPVHAVSPVIGACPVEANPVPVAAGRPRATSVRWRSPTGMFELGGLGLGDLKRGGDVVRAARTEDERKERERYEHVDTPGEFGLGVEKEREIEAEGENPYFT